MAKVSIIGAGNVGALSAMRISRANLADVVLVDIAEDLAKAKSLDISDALAINNIDKKVSAAADYNRIADSDIVIITAGLPRKPGMSRDDLLIKNSEIIKGVSENIKKYCPNCIVIVVTNPLDVMSYLAYQATGFVKSKIIGMAGILDSGRFSSLISGELNIGPSEIKTKVLGSHGDFMIPLVGHSSISGKPLTELLSREKINELVGKTKKRGGEIVSLLGTGSASFGPSEGVLCVARAILNDTKEEICVSAYLNGEYGIKDTFIGVPAIIGKEGIEKIVELELSEDEKQTLNTSAKIIKDSLRKLEG